METQSNIKQLVILSVIFCLLTLLSLAQSASPDVIASAGDHFSSPSGSVSWTIGEPVVDTYSSSPNVLTKGFHQPVMVSLAGIAENNSGNGFYAYPNPVGNELVLDFSKMKSDVYRITMYDVTGQVVKNMDVSWMQGGKPQTISMESIRAGIYFLHISSAGAENIVLRIIRQ